MKKSLTICRQGIPPPSCSARVADRGKRKDQILAHEAFHQIGPEPAVTLHRHPQMRHMPLLYRSLSGPRRNQNISHGRAGHGRDECGGIHRNIVEYRVGACEVDVLKYAGAELLLGALAADEVAVLRDDDHLTRLHVANALEANGSKRTVLGRNAPLGAVWREACAEHERPDAVGVPERYQPHALDEADARERAL